MVHLRLVVPLGLARPALDVLRESPAVVNVVRLPGASIKPRGDLACLSGAGIATLAVQRGLYKRRRVRHRHRPATSGPSSSSVHRRP